MLLDDPENFYFAAGEREKGKYMKKKLFTVVLCDDEAAVIEELQQAVDWSRIGMEVVGTAANGNEALDLIVRKAPDVAVVDINMPGLSGLDMIQHVRRARISTDFIILSGYDTFSYAQTAIQSGVSAYLLKPLNLSEFYETLSRILLKRSQRSGDRDQCYLYQKEVAENFFRNLIDGRIQEETIIQVSLETPSIHLNDASSYVLVLRWPQEISFQEAETERILHLLDSTFEDQHRYFFRYSDKQIIGIFNTSEHLDFANAEEIIRVFRGKNISLPLIGIGDTVSSLLSIPYSYSRALTALTYQLYSDDSNIFTYDMICTTPPKMQLSDIDILPLVQHIVKKEKDGIEAYVDDFMKKLLYVRMPAPNYVYSMCYSLNSMIEKEFSSYSHDEIHQITSPNELYHFHSLKEIRNWLIGSFTRLSEFIDAVYGYGKKAPSASKEKAEKTDDEIITKAKAYIHSHLTDGLRIDSIAREVNLSTSYFAIYFKQKTGVNLRDYILQVKMEYARKALLSPDASVTEIAYRLGYQDYRSFSRAFKNLIGITPSDFHQKHSH